MDSGLPEPAYRLYLAGWPAREGRKFLLDSACVRHRPRIAGLLVESDERAFGPGDMAALAELLLEHCAGEPDFATRGSLMDRVRGALLLARGASVALSALAMQLGEPPARLRRKLAQHEGKWVERVAGG